MKFKYNTSFTDLERAYILRSAIKILEFDNYFKADDVRLSLDDGNAHVMCPDLSMWNSKMKKYNENH